VERSIVETERLIVRALNPGGIEAPAPLWSDPIATAYLGRARKFDEVCRMLREHVALPEQPNFDPWATIEKASGRGVSGFAQKCFT